MKKRKIIKIKIQQWWCRKTWKSTGKYKSDYCHQHKTNHFLCSVEWEMKRKKLEAFFLSVRSVCTVVRYWTDVEHRQRLLLLRFNYWIEYENIYVNRHIHTYVVQFLSCCVYAVHIKSYKCAEQRQKMFSILYKKPNMCGYRWQHCFVIVHVLSKCLLFYYFSKNYMLHSQQLIGFCHVIIYIIYGHLIFSFVCILNADSSCSFYCVLQTSL
jgi:hypothetical protein